MTRSCEFVVATPQAWFELFAITILVGKSDGGQSLKAGSCTSILEQ
jgi:hypothetical protein